MAIIRPNSNARFEFSGLSNAKASIGDRTAAFAPIITIDRFANEANEYASQIILESADRPGPAVEFGGGIISQSANGKIHTFYESSPGLQWDIDYNGRPTVDEEFILTLPPGASLHYQPALTDEEIAEGSIRPDNVVGSYYIRGAKRGHVQGDFNYESGKLGHLFAFYLLDKDTTNKVKVPIIVTPIGGNQYKVETDYTSVQSFIDLTPNTKLDPTIGLTSKGGTGYLSSNYYIWAMKDSTDGTGGTTSAIHAWVLNTTSAGSRTFNFCIYDDNAGLPGDQLLTEVLMTIPADFDGEESVAFVTSLSASTPYWIAAQVGSPQSQLWYDTRAVTDDDKYYNPGAFGMPATFPTPTGSLNREYSVWPVYAATGGATPKNRILQGPFSGPFNGPF